MVRPRVNVIVALATFLLLTNVCPYEAQSTCSGCTVFPYVDSPGDDIVSFVDKIPVECADLCFTASECVGFVISPDRTCWLKRVIKQSSDLNSQPERTVVVTGDNNCQGLFSS